MRHQYSIVLAGCAGHLAVLIAAILLYVHQQTVMPDRDTFPDGATIVLILLNWPIWGYYLWSHAKRAKIWATMIPIVIGVLIILPFLLLFVLKAVLGNGKIHM